MVAKADFWACSCNFLAGIYILKTSNEYQEDIIEQS